MNRKRVLSGLALLSLVVLGWAAPGATIAAEPAATPAVSPATTPTAPVASTAVSQPVPSPQPGPTLTPTPATISAVVAVAAGNVRSGPGMAYPVIGQVRQGDSLAVVHRDEAGSWLQIVWEREPAWLSLSLVSLSADVSKLSVGEALPPPTAAAQATPVSAGPTPPMCDSVPIRGFGQVWGERPEVAAGLGCPSGWPAGEQGTTAVAQAFEHGLMLWLAGDSASEGDPIYVLFDTGDFQRFPNMGAVDAAVTSEVPAGFYPPADRFAKVYWEGTGARVKERLGYATDQPADSAASYQEFWNGQMIWVDALKRIFALYDYWEYDKANDTSTRVRAWAGFEDTFGPKP